MSRTYISNDAKILIALLDGPLSEQQLNERTVAMHRNSRRRAVAALQESGTIQVATDRSVILSAHIRYGAPKTVHPAPPMVQDQTEPAPKTVHSAPPTVHNHAKPAPKTVHPAPATVHAAPPVVQAPALCTPPASALACSFLPSIQGGKEGTRETEGSTPAGPSPMPPPRLTALNQLVRKLVLEVTTQRGGTGDRLHRGQAHTLASVAGGEAEIRRRIDAWRADPNAVRRGWPVSFLLAAWDVQYALETAAQSESSAAPANESKLDSSAVEDLVGRSLNNAQFREIVSTFEAAPTRDVAKIRKMAFEVIERVDTQLRAQFVGVQ